HFLKNKLNARTGQPVQITRQAMEVLSAHDWPGNVRELENAIERAATLCENNVIQVADLPPSLVRNLPAASAPQAQPGDIAQLPVTAGSAANLYPLTNNSPVMASSEAQSSPQADSSLKDFLREQELTYLNRTLAQTGGDKEKAALILGISLATLYR